MRPRRKKRSTKPWHFDDYDESEYTLDSECDYNTNPNRAICRRNNYIQPQNLDLCPKNSHLQIKISGNISISLIGNNGQKKEIFRFVIIKKK